jgi:hypothetical protein
MDEDDCAELKTPQDLEREAAEHPAEFKETVQEVKRTSSVAFGMICAVSNPKMHSPATEKQRWETDKVCSQPEWRWAAEPGVWAQHLTSGLSPADLRHRLLPVVADEGRLV